MRHHPTVEEDMSKEAFIFILVWAVLAGLLGGFSVRETYKRAPVLLSQVTSDCVEIVVECGQSVTYEDICTRKLNIVCVEE